MWEGKWNVWQKIEMDEIDEKKIYTAANMDWEVRQTGSIIEIWEGDTRRLEGK